MTRPKQLLLAVALACMFFPASMFAQGNCLHFDGTNDFVNAGDVASLNGASKLTIEMWVNIETWNTWDTFFSKSNGDPFSFTRIQFQLYSTPGDLGVVVQTAGSGGYGNTTSQPVHTGEWFHLAMVYDGDGFTDADRLKLYINGAQQTLEISPGVPTTTPITTAPVLLGAETVASPHGFNGTMDEARVWTSARTEAQILGAMNAVLVGNDAGLLMYYNFDQGVAGADNADSTTLRDITTNHHDGALANFALNGSTSNWIARAYAAPTVQASAIVALKTYAAQLNFGWTNGSGSSRAVFVSADTTEGNPVPLDGWVYTGNAALGAGTQIGVSGWYCIYNGSANSAKVTGLSESVTYRVAVCEYNVENGDAIYNTTFPGTNPANLTTVLQAVAPTVQASELSLTTYPDGSVHILWTIGDGSKRIVFLKQTTSGAPVPVNDTVYVANHAFGFGSEIPTTGWFAVYSGTGDSVVVTGISGSTAYRAMVCEFNESGSNIQYNTIVALNNPANIMTPSNPFNWSTIGGGGINPVYALAVDSTTIYAGGPFTSMGGVAARYMAKWNGVAWSALGAGPAGPVSAIAVTGDTVYAAGFFGPFGETGTPSVSMWDGATWTPLGAFPPDAFVNALVIYKGELYAGGEFTQIGGVAANHIARWDGAAWNAIGVGASNTVYGLAADENALYASGKFVTIGAATANGIARWDGTTWTALGTGVNIGGGEIVTTVALGGSTVYAGGLFVAIDGVTVNGIARLVGESWSAIGGAQPIGSICAIAAHGNDVYLGGQFGTIDGVGVSNIAKWDGSVWGPIGTSANNGVSGSFVWRMAMQPATNSMIVAGNFLTASGIAGTRNIARFTDEANPLPIQLASFTAAFATGSSVMLRWTTASEVNNYGYFVQSKPTRATAFTDIAGSFIAGHGTTVTAHSYGFTVGNAADRQTSYRLRQIDLDGTIHFSEAVTATVTGVKETVPLVFALYQNYPNPFNPTTVVSFQLPVASAVRLVVYDMLGREVAVLLNERRDAGNHTVKFNAAGVATGVYIYRLTAGTMIQSRKLVLVR